MLFLPQVFAAAFGVAVSADVALDDAAGCDVADDDVAVVLLDGRRGVLVGRNLLS